MTEFILANVMMLSAGAVLYLFIRALPRIEERESPRREHLIDRLLRSGATEKLDAVLNLFLEKILRRVKVFLLKIDNVLSHRLRIIKSENGKKESLVEGFRKMEEEKNGPEPNLPGEATE